MMNMQASGPELAPAEPVPPPQPATVPEPAPEAAPDEPAPTPVVAPLLPAAPNPRSWARAWGRAQRILRPLPGDALPWAPLWRWLLGGGLAGLAFVGGVVPYVWPQWLATGQPTWPLPGAAKTPANLPAGTRLRDCADDSCPWLVVIAPGSFLMGSPENEIGRSDDEGPQHKVTLAKPLAVMETEVTVGMFKTFVAETGYNAAASRCIVWENGDVKNSTERSWKNPFAGQAQTDLHPVVCVNWPDAQAFARWMSQRTGQLYRLLSEAEWEYAARAGFQTRWSFGENEKYLCQYANVADATLKKYGAGGENWEYTNCEDGFAFTAPVRSFRQNQWGLSDMHGNAWEWTQDCFQDYNSTESDGKAVEKDNCTRRTVRGGGWFSVPQGTRSAFRDGIIPTDRNLNVGFRLARMLP